MVCVCRGGGGGWGSGRQALLATWSWFGILSAKPVEAFSLVIPVLCALGARTPGKQTGRNASRKSL